MMPSGSRMLSSLVAVLFCSYMPAQAEVSVDDALERSPAVMRAVLRSAVEDYRALLPEVREILTASLSRCPDDAPEKSFSYFSDEALYQTYCDQKVAAPPCIEALERVRQVYDQYEICSGEGVDLSELREAILSTRECSMFVEKLGKSGLAEYLLARYVLRARAAWSKLPGSVSEPSASPSEPACEGGADVQLLQAVFAQYEGWAESSTNSPSRNSKELFSESSIEILWGAIRSLEELRSCGKREHIGLWPGRQEVVLQQLEAQGAFLQSLEVDAVKANVLESFANGSDWLQEISAPSILSTSISSEGLVERVAALKREFSTIHAMLTVIGAECARTEILDFEQRVYQLQSEMSAALKVVMEELIQSRQIAKAR